MFFWFTAFAVLCAAGVSVSAHRPPDIVADAARAVAAQDQETLEAMQFTALGFDLKPISIALLLSQVERCEKVAEYKRGEKAMAHQIHYDCPDAPKPKMKCASPTIIVAIDRATSPDVTAYLQYKRLDTPECLAPQAPAAAP